MKVLIPILIGLLVVGCGKKQADTNESTPTTNTNKVNGTTAKPVKELTLEEKIVGTYEIKKDGNTLRIVLLENGIVEAYSNGKKKEKEVEWKIVDREIHGVEEDGNITVIRINKDGGITFIENIDKDRKRKDLPKDQQLTLKKIK
jgi:hypothetical protein